MQLGPLDVSRGLGPVSVLTAVMCCCLSAECKNLLRQLLHPDSEKRVKMAGIMADPWFRTDLPPDALNMNDKYLANTRTCTQSESEIRAIVAAATNYNTGDSYMQDGF